MDDRTKVAASLAAVVPFHCMICCEEYNLLDRYPVILPCGHTYLCVQCSKRLKRCMECRESLFWTPAASSPSPLNPLSAPLTPGPNGGLNISSSNGNSPALQYGKNTNAMALSTSTNSRSLTPPPPAPAMYARGSPSPVGVPSHRLYTTGYSTGAIMPPLNNHYHTASVLTPPKPIPLPTPKNQVLIAMMEAAERQSKRVLEEQEEALKKERMVVTDENDPDFSRVSSSGGGDDEDEEEFDLNCIISGMSTFSGPCGTYIVKDPNGLVVLPNDPREENHDLFVPSLRHSVRDEAVDDEEEKKQECDDEEDQHADEPLLPTPCLKDAELRKCGIKEPFRLSTGQTVQIADYREGVFRLARGYGYIVGTAAQLVKVGGPLEEACRLEGVLNTVLERGEDLARELEENNKLAASIREQIKKSLVEQPVHPIVGPCPTIEEVSVSESMDDSEDLSDTDSDVPPSTPIRGVEHRRLPKEPSSAPEATTGPHHVTFDRSPRPAFLIPNRSSDLDADENSVALFPSRTQADPSSPHSIDNADLRRRSLPVYRVSAREDFHQITFGCGSTLLSDGVDLFGDSESVPVSNNELWAPTGRGQNRRSNSEEECIQVGPTMTSSFDGVDFRTGLSGHRGLHPGKKASTARRGQIRMMSEHRGISQIRGRRRNDAPPSPNSHYSQEHRHSPYLSRHQTAH